MPVLLQVNITVNNGSTGRIADQIGQSALSQGWESYIAYGDNGNSSDSCLFRIGNGLNRYLHFAEQRLFDNEGLCSRLATRHFIDSISNIKPDIIQLHNIHDHYLNYRILFEYLNQTDIKVVWTFHDCWAFTGHCMHFVTKNCDRWKSGCHDCLMRGEYPRTFLDRSRQNWTIKREMFLSNRNLNIVACSEWIASYVKDSFLKDKPLSVIHNGIDLNVFHPVDRTRRTNEFEVLAVSNVWNTDKGFDDIIRLRSMLSDSIGITIIGLTKEQKNNLPPGIKGVERTQDVEDLVKYYSSADVFINPTYADTFPTVNLEALACGTPVITYKTGGSPEAVDRNTGIVVERGDIVGIVEAINRITRKPVSRQSCRSRAVEFFDKNLCYKSYLDLYNSLL